MGQYYDPNKKYGHDGFLGVLDAGASMEGGAAAARKADLNAVVTGLDADIRLKGGMIDEQQHAEMKQAGAEQVAKDYKADMNRVNTTSAINMVTNSAGIVLSCVGIAGTAGGGKLATGASAKLAAAAENSSGAKQVALKVASKVTGGFGKFGGLGNGKMEVVTNGVSKMKYVHSFSSRAAIGAAKAGVMSTPAIAAQIYTRGKTHDLVTDLDNQAGALQATYDYLTSEDASLTDQIKSDTEEWTKGYEARGQELLDAYSRGELTQEQYDEQYRAYVEEYDQKWSEFRDGHKDTAEYVTEHGTAYAANEWAAQKGVDPDSIEKNCAYIADRNEQNPNAKEAAKSAIESQKELDTGSSFTNFLANLNATLLHYAPGLAYVEAAAVKAFDVAADFAANKIPGLSAIVDYEEKHKGEGIGDIARSICTDAEARYEASHEASEDMQEFADAKDPEKALAEAKQQGGMEMAPA